MVEKNCLFDKNVKCQAQAVSDLAISLLALAEKVCPICPTRIRMVEGKKPQD